MSCAYPITAWRSRLYKSKKPGGLFFSEPSFLPAGSYEEIAIPCGQCMLCRLDYSKKWAIRLEHEAQFHRESCFLTLTYDDEHLPLTKDGLPTLCYRDVTNFIKKLRIFLERKYKSLNLPVPDFQYFYCGEYGPKTFRPHYHLIIFGYFPRDARYFSGKRDHQLFTSEEIFELWTRKNVSLKKMESLGFHLVAFNDWDTFRYVAGYVTKKFKSSKKEKEAFLNGRQEDKILMSRRPAIGKNWLLRYHADVYPLDHIVTSRGSVTRPPRYYDDIFFGEINHEMERTVRERRRAYLLDHPLDHNRLQAREAISRRKQKLGSDRGKL